MAETKEQAFTPEEETTSTEQPEQEVQQSECEEICDCADETPADGKPDENAEKIQKLCEELAGEKDRYLRLMAEYDNFRKRSAKERLELSANVTADVVKDLLPVYDNFERAMATQCADETFRAGMEMIYNQFTEALKKLGVEIINPQGEEFDPNIANAVNQVEDENLGQNVVAQVFQKGYKIGEKVIRYAMVSVANP